MRRKGMPSMWEVSHAIQNTDPEKDCDKKDNGADTCTNTGNSLNSNTRPCRASLPMGKDNAVYYLLLGMTNNEPITKETNNENEYFFQIQAKRVTKE